MASGKSRSNGKRSFTVDRRFRDHPSGWHVLATGSASSAGHHRFINPPRGCASLRGMASPFLLENVMQMIDLAPTWGEFGLVYARLAESGEVDAVRAMRSDVLRAFAAAQTLSALAASNHPLTNEQMDIVSMTLLSELRKLGVTQPAPHEPDSTIDDEVRYRVFDPVCQATLDFADLNKAIEAVRNLDANYFVGLNVRQETVGRYERSVEQWFRNGVSVDLDRMLFDAALGKV